MHRKGNLFPNVPKKGGLRLSISDGKHCATQYKTAYKNRRAKDAAEANFGPWQWYLENWRGYLRLPDNMGF